MEAAMIPDALKPAICPKCVGAGAVTVMTGGPDGYLVPEGAAVCPTCGGSGLNPDMISVHVRHVRENAWPAIDTPKAIVIPLEN
jgi:hypothetical protein